MWERRVFTAEVSITSSLGRAGISLAEGKEMGPKWKLSCGCSLESERWLKRFVSLAGGQSMVREKELI